MHILKFIFIMLEVLVLFNLLIFVHELGHFLAARWRGLKIDRFAIWFGKPIWKKKINGVEYALGSIPAGGYVALPQMATMDAIEGKGEDSGEPLPPISPLDKIIVAFAGPLFSFGLAMVFAVVVMMIGRPVSETETTTVVGYAEENGPADKAGMLAGDRILTVDGKPVSKFGGMGDSIMWRVVSSEGATIPITVERQVDGQKKIIEFNPTPVKDATKAWQRASLRQIKIAPAQSAIIAEVTSNSPAGRVGLKPLDEVLMVNGIKLHHFENMTDYLDKHPGEKLDLEIMRGSTVFHLAVTPEKPISPPDLGPRIGIRWSADGKSSLAYPGAIEQVRGSVDAMISTFGALFSKKSDIKPQHLGGAVKILSVYYFLFESKHGWRQAIWFSVLMNVNLALLNLLPFPVLDGGHIFLALLEAVRRRPLSGRIVGWIQTGCAVALIIFMVYIFFYDVQELPWSRNREKTPEMKFAPQEQPARN